MDPIKFPVYPVLEALHEMEGRVLCEGDVLYVVSRQWWEQWLVYELGRAGEPVIVKLPVLSPDVNCMTSMSSVQLKTPDAGQEVMVGDGDVCCSMQFVLAKPDEFEDQASEPLSLRDLHDTSVGSQEGHNLGVRSTEAHGPSLAAHYGTHSGPNHESGVTSSGGSNLHRASSHRKQRGQGGLVRAPSGRLHDHSHHGHQGHHSHGHPQLQQSSTTESATQGEGLRSGHGTATSIADTIPTNVDSRMRPLNNSDLLARSGVSRHGSHHHGGSYSEGARSATSLARQLRHETINVVSDDHIAVELAGLEEREEGDNQSAPGLLEETNSTEVWLKPNLRPRLKMGIDYVLFTEKAWRALRARTEEATVRRRIVRDAGKGLILEIYGIQASIALSSAMDAKRKVPFSRAAQLREVAGRVCALFDVNPREARLWTAINGSLFEVLYDMDRQLADAIMNDTPELVLEKRISEGVWPQDEEYLAQDLQALADEERKQQPYPIGDQAPDPYKALMALKEMEGLGRQQKHGSSLGVSSLRVPTISSMNENDMMEPWLSAWLPRKPVSSTTYLSAQLMKDFAQLAPTGSTHSLALTRRGIKVAQRRNQSHRHVPGPRLTRTRHDSNRHSLGDLTAAASTEAAHGSEQPGGQPRLITDRYGVQESRQVLQQLPQSQRRWVRILNRIGIAASWPMANAGALSAVLAAMFGSGWWCQKGGLSGYLQSAQLDTRNKWLTYPQHEHLIMAEDIYSADRLNATGNSDLPFAVHDSPAVRAMLARPKEELPQPCDFLQVFSHMTDLYERYLTEDDPNYAGQYADVPDEDDEDDDAHVLQLQDLLFILAALVPASYADPGPLDAHESTLHILDMFMEATQSQRSEEPRLQDLRKLTSMSLVNTAQASGYDPDVLMRVATGKNDRGQRMRTVTYASSEELLVPDAEGDGLFGLQAPTLDGMEGMMGGLIDAVRSGLGFAPQRLGTFAAPSESSGGSAGPSAAGSRGASFSTVDEYSASASIATINRASVVPSHSGWDVPIVEEPEFEDDFSHPEPNEVAPKLMAPSMDNYDRSMLGSSAHGVDSDSISRSRSREAVSSTGDLERGMEMQPLDKDVDQSKEHEEPKETSPTTVPAAKVDSDDKAASNDGKAPDMPNLRAGNSFVTHSPTGALKIALPIGISYNIAGMNTQGVRDLADAVWREFVRLKANPLTERYMAQLCHRSICAKCGDARAEFQPTVGLNLTIPNLTLEKLVVLVFYRDPATLWAPEELVVTVPQQTTILHLKEAVHEVSGLATARQQVSLLRGSTFAWVEGSFILKDHCPLEVAGHNASFCVFEYETPSKDHLHPHRDAGRRPVNMQEARQALGMDARPEQLIPVFHARASDAFTDHDSYWGLPGMLVMDDADTTMEKLRQDVEDYFSGFRVLCQQHRDRDINVDAAASGGGHQVGATGATSWSTNKGSMLASAQCRHAGQAVGTQVRFKKKRGRGGGAARSGSPSRRGERSRRRSKNTSQRQGDARLSTSSGHRGTGQGNFYGHHRRSSVASSEGGYSETSTVRSPSVQSDGSQNRSGSALYRLRKPRTAPDETQATCTMHVRTFAAGDAEAPMEMRPTLEKMDREDLQQAGFHIIVRWPDRFTECQACYTGRCIVERKHKMAQEQAQEEVLKSRWKQKMFHRFGARKGRVALDGHKGRAARVLRREKHAPVAGMVPESSRRGAVTPSTVDIGGAGVLPPVPMPLMEDIDEELLMSGNSEAIRTPATESRPNHQQLDSDWSRRASIGLLRNTGGEPDSEKAASAAPGRQRLLRQAFGTSALPAPLSSEGGARSTAGGRETGSGGVADPDHPLRTQSASITGKGQASVPEVTEFTGFGPTGRTSFIYSTVTPGGRLSPGPADPLDMEQNLVCGLGDCLAVLLQAHHLAEARCTACGETGGITTATSIVRLPQQLLISLQRFDPQFMRQSDLGLLFDPDDIDLTYMIEKISGDSAVGVVSSFASHENDRMMPGGSGAQLLGAASQRNSSGGGAHHQRRSNRTSSMAPGQCQSSGRYRLAAMVNYSGPPGSGEHRTILRNPWENNQWATLTRDGFALVDLDEELPSEDCYLLYLENLDEEDELEFVVPSSHPRHVREPAARDIRIV
eukprot:Clim_evm4s218 gene=Clim_evmTU4s218